MRAAGPVLGCAVLCAFGAALSCAGERPEASGSRDSSGAPDPAATVSGVPSLRLEADVTVLESGPVQLRGILRVENPTPEPISFDVGGCPAFLRVYGAGGEPIWDQGDGAICTMLLRTVTLAPGRAERFETATASAAEILSDDHPDGAYAVAVYLALVPEGRPEAPAGEVRLSIPRGP